MNMLCELKKLQVHVNKLGLNNFESTHGTYIIKFEIDKTTYTGVLMLYPYQVKSIEMPLKKKIIV